MDIKTLLESGHNISITITISDLKELVRYIIDMDKNEAVKDVLLTVEEAMALLKVRNRATLWRWEKRGYLQPINIGSSVRYSKTDIENMLKGNKK